MLRINLLFFLFLFCKSISAQHQIEFDIKNYDSDTIVIGYHIMDKQLVLDTVVTNDKGKFFYRSEDDLPGGVYLLLMQPGGEYIQFLINDYEKEFTIKADYESLDKLKFKGSEDNSIFQDYVQFLSEVRPGAEMLRDTIARLKENDIDTDWFESQLSEIDNRVKDRQEKIILDHPRSTSALLIKANQIIPVKEFDDAENPDQARYLYYKKHYFDNLPLDNPVTLRTPVMFQRIDYYLNKLTPNHPDSIIVSIDHVLDLINGAEESYKYYLSHFLNEYAASRIVGYDAIYVHLADKYYSQGKAPWVGEENLAKIMDNADKLRPVLIGKTAENITVYDEFNNPISISDIDYEYLVLLFWAPDCSHCKKMMPQFIDFNDRWKDKGVRTFAICTKHQDKVDDCWAYVKEKNMHGFINAADKYHRSQFKFKFNVQTTPKVFILDKDRKILLKNVGADQLDNAMESILNSEF